MLRFVAVLVAAMLSTIAHAQPLTKIVFGTNWYAQAEHGGFYQAIAEGIYRKHGLDVTIRMGGRRSTACNCCSPGRWISSWATTSRR